MLLRDEDKTLKHHLTSSQLSAGALSSRVEAKVRPRVDAGAPVACRALGTELRSRDFTSLRPTFTSYNTIYVPTTANMPMSGRTRPIEKFAEATARCTAEVCHPPEAPTRTLLRQHPNERHRELSTGNAWPLITRTSAKTCVQGNLWH